MRTALNIVVFYAGWIATVVLAARGYGTAALAAALSVVALHLLVAQMRGLELRIMTVAAGTGLVVEGLLMAAGYTQFASPGPVVGLPPAWLLGLWLAFATTITTSLGWLIGRPLTAAIAGFFLAPLSYWAGVRLGGMTLSAPSLESLAAIGLAWAIALPMLMIAANRWTNQQNVRHAGTGA